MYTFVHQYLENLFNGIQESTAHVFVRYRSRLHVAAKCLAESINHCAKNVKWFSIVSNYKCDEDLIGFVT